MATVGCAIRMGEGSQGTQAQVRAVASSEREEGGQSAHEQVASREVQSQRTIWSLEDTSSSATEPLPVEVHRLEAAVLAVRQGNEHSKPLFKALEVARSSGEEDRGFPRKSLEASRSSGGSHCVQEVAESERRLAQLEAQARVLPTQVDVQVDATVGVLQERIDVLQKERDALLAAATPVFQRPAPVWM